MFAAQDSKVPRGWQSWSVHQLLNILRTIEWTIITCCTDIYQRMNHTWSFPGCSYNTTMRL